MRYLLLLTLLLATGVLAGLIYQELTLGPPVVLPPPSGLAASAPNASILPDGWTNASSMRLQAQSAVPAHLEVEIRPESARFSGRPTVTTAASPGDPSMTVRLADGRYHWQARLHNDRGVSPWVAASQVINVDTHPPASPSISSPTDPDRMHTYHTSTAQFAWQAGDVGSGLAGYSYRLDADPHGQARAELRTAGTAITLTGLDTGTWYFHVRALDRAGNWGPGTTFPIHIDVTPPGLQHVRFNLFYLDPKYDALRVSFAVTRPATTLRVGIYRQSDNALVRLYTLDHLAKGQATAVSWDGKDAHGTLAGAGGYAVYIRAIDRYGHSSLSSWRDFIVDYRRIVVSLSQQRLWAYDGSRLLLTSLVTTGNRALPTPTGTFHIMAKFHPFTFISPWPKKSPYYYPPSKVVYAMLFREGGYFLHDAPWRSAFGPGTNQGVGTPGQNYTGTHGCVNVPSDAMRQLYAWARTGSVVQVVP